MPAAGLIACAVAASISASFLCLCSLLYPFLYYRCRLYYYSPLLSLYLSLSPCLIGLSPPLRPYIYYTSAFCLYTPLSPLAYLNTYLIPVVGTLLLCYLLLYTILLTAALPAPPYLYLLASFLPAL
jgi:hypothetical protein